MNRSIAPAYAQSTELNVVAPEKIELKNGVILFWLKDVKDDSVKLEVSWRAGSKYQSKKLSASFVNKMLLAGTPAKKSQTIAEEIDFYGGYVQPEIDKDHAGLTIYGLAQNISNIFKVVSDAFEYAAFPQSELSKELDIALSKFKVEQQKVKFLARRSFVQNIFGSDTAYGQLSNEIDFQSLQREDLITFYQEHYRNPPIIFLTGNVDASFIEELNQWSTIFTHSAASPIHQKFNQKKGTVEVAKEDAVQVALRVGRLMFKKNHEDYFDFQVLNTILGGYFGSRLMANIREDKGYTYGIGSGLAVLEDVGYFFISTEVKKEVYKDAIHQISYELDLLKKEEVSNEELAKVKNYMLGEFLRQADGPISMMEMHKNLFYHDLSPTYYQDFIQSILKVNSARIQQLAKTYFDEESLLTVAAGT